MSLAYNLAASLGKAATPTDEDITTLVIDHYTRTINIPKGITTLGVESDDDVLRLNFRMPRYLGTVDLYNFSIRVNYINAAGEDDVYKVTDKTIVGNDITFSWLVGPTAVAYKGTTKFNVCMVVTDSESVVKQEYNTAIASLPVLEGMETSERIVSDYTDILEQWESRLFGIGDTEESNLVAVSEAQQTAIVNKGAEVLATIPAEYQATVKMADTASRTKADAIICSAEGETITVHDSSDDYLRGLKIFGKTTQVKTTGKNLFDVSKIASNSRVTNNNGTITISTPEGSSAVDTMTKLGAAAPGLEVGKSYILTFDTTGASDYIYLEEAKYMISRGKANTFTQEMLDSDILLYASGVSTSATLTNFMIRDASITDASYEPYSGGVASPSPEWPQELVSIGNNNPISVAIIGKNILDPNALDVSSNTALTVSNDGYTIVAKGGTTSGWSSSIYTFPTELTKTLRGKRIYISCDSFTSEREGSGTRAGFNVTLESGETIYPVSAGPSNLSVSAVVPMDATKLLFGLYSNNSGTVFETDNTVTVKGLRVSVFEQIDWTPYQPVQLVNLTRTFPGIPVTSGGNYTDSNGQQWICDEIDFERGVYVQRTGTRVLTGDTSEQWGLYNPAEEGKVFHCYLVMKNYARRWPTTFCDRFRNVSIVWERQEYGLFSDYNTSDLLYFSAPNADVIDMSTWRTWLSNNPTTLVYLLATPIETPLTADELAVFQALKSNYPNTTVLNGAGAQMSLRYNADTKDYIDAHNSDNAIRWINVVEAYGVDNTGVTDVGAKVQDIIDSVEECSILYFPSGDYLFNTGVIINKKISFVGDTRMLADVPRIKGGATRFTTKGIPNFTMFTCNASTNYSFENILLYSDSATTIENKTEPTSGKPHFHYELVRTYTNVNGIIDNSDSLNCYFNNVWISGFSGTGIKAARLATLDTVVAYSCGVGIETKYDCLVHNGRCWGCEIGGIMGVGTAIQNGRFEESQKYGMIAYGSNKFTSVTIDQCGYAGLVLRNYAEDITYLGKITRCGQYYFGTSADTYNVDANRIEEAFSTIYAETNASKLTFFLTGEIEATYADSGTTKSSVYLLKGNISDSQFHLKEMPDIAKIHKGEGQNTVYSDKQYRFDNGTLLSENGVSLVSYDYTSRLHHRGDNLYVRNSDGTAYNKLFMPENRLVIATTYNNAEQVGWSYGGTWTQLGSIPVGETTVYFYVKS